MSDNMGDWGKKTDVNDNVHISQTNDNARVGSGAHVTTNIPGTGGSQRDYFDSNGNYDSNKSGFGQR